jgi:hypothetical protein
VDTFAPCARLYRARHQGNAARVNSPRPRPDANDFRRLDPGFRIPHPVAKAPGPMGGVLRANFDRAKLEEAIDYVLGDGGKVEVVDVPRPLVATCATTKSPFVMTNISGVAYAPDLVAVGEVLADARASLETLRLLSIGTAGPDPASVPTDIGRRGFGRW